MPCCAGVEFPDLPRELGVRRERAGGHLEVLAAHGAALLFPHEAPQPRVAAARQRHGFAGYEGVRGAVLVHEEFLHVLEGVADEPVRLVAALLLLLRLALCAVRELHRLGSVVELRLAAQGFRYGPRCGNRCAPTSRGRVPTAETECLSSRRRPRSRTPASRTAPGPPRSGSRNRSCLRTTDGRTSPRWRRDRAFRITSSSERPLSGASGAATGSRVAVRALLSEHAPDDALVAAPGGTSMVCGVPARCLPVTVKYRPRS